jgi:large subunit ribosomal protein L7/L12
MAETAAKSAKELVIETIENMKVLELAELVSELQERFGVSAAMAPVAAAAPAAAEAPQEEEKTSFDAVLSIIGDKKIQVIKVVRQLTGLGLKEAKALVDEAPKPVKEGVTKEEAEEIKKKLEEVGATIELK